MSPRAIGVAAIAAWMLAAVTSAQAQKIPVFDGIDWLMDRGANTFGTVSGNAGSPPIPTVDVIGLALRQGTSAFNARTLDAAGNPDGFGVGKLLNNDPWHAVRRNVWPRTTDLNIANALQTEIIDNPNLADPNHSTDSNGNQTRVQPLPAGIPNPIDMAHAYLFNGGFNWIGPLPVAPGAVGDYRSPAEGFSFSTDLTQTYTNDYAFVAGVHNDFVVDRPGGNQSPATAGELASLPYTTPEVYAAVERVLKNTATAKAVWELGSYNNIPARFTIDMFSPGDGTVILNQAFPNVTRAIVRVSYGHVPTPADANNVQTVDAQGNPIKAGVEDSRYSRLFLVDLGQSGWINVAPGGRAPSAFDYSGDPRYQIVVTLYTVTPDDPNDKNTFGNVPAQVTADAVRFNPQVVGTNSPGLTQTADGNPVTAANPAIYSIAPTGRILGPVVGTNKTGLDTPPLVYVAREEGVPNTTPIIPFDPTQPSSASNPLVADPTLSVTAPVFYCLDSQDSSATKVVGMNTVQTVSVDRVRWRYVGLPDAPNGSGTSSASPLLTNVRCRDGIIRTILYYVTTNATGTVGHIYALDPVGDRKDQMKTVNLNTTTAYWVYPSYRPLTPTEVTANVVPPQYHDPNYNNSMPYTTGVGAVDMLETRNASGSLSAAPPFGPDSQVGPEKVYVDGDIVTNPAAAGSFIVRADTQVPFTGMQSSPVVMDDPDNITGGQILIVGGMNGRVYCMDAGGRGDFIYDNTHQNDAINPATGIPFSIPGTTQRYWAWPHLSGDAFHAAHGSGSVSPGLNITNTIIDETSKVSFPGSPAFEGITGPNTNAFYIGGGDGHMFALFSKHDKFNGISNTNMPLYDERRSWVYPNSPSSKQDTETLGAAPSTPAIFTPTGAAQPYLYFTCNGRVYSLLAHPLLNGTPTFINNTAPTTGLGNGWVFPFTNNPPFPNPNDSFSASLDPGFNGCAPTLISAADLNNAPATTFSPLVTNDFCYVVQGTGTVYAIDAFAGTVKAIGQSFTGGSTRSSAIATRITGLLGFADPTVPVPPNGTTSDTTTSLPSLVFSDDDGAIWAVNARPNTTAVDPVLLPGILQLPTVWAHLDTASSRPAAAALMNAYLYEGGEDGQLRGYGVGTGLNGLGGTLDAGEPAETGFGISPSGISIDIRGLNLYNAPDYALMTQANPTKTPNPAGSNAATPLVGTINPNTGSNDHTTWPALLDWGDAMYIAGFGVYHAQPQNNTTGTRAPADATGVPAIQIQLTIKQPNQQSIQVTLTPQFTTNAANVSNGFNWPNDPLVGNGISIYGVDDPSLERNMNSNPSGEQITGRTNTPDSGANPPVGGVFPYTFFYKLPILPDGTKPFTPGASGYTVTAHAILTQNVMEATKNSPVQSYSESSNFLEIGQHDLAGLSPVDPSMPASPTNPVGPSDPNQINKIGRRRDVIISNPIAVTTRSFIAAGGGTADMTANNQPNVIGMGPSSALVANPFEVASNGNRVSNPYALPGSTASPIKPLFAPVQMTPHGASSTYTGVDNGGNKVQAFYIADRSNMAYTGPGGAARHLRVQIRTKPPRWLGGNSSVMNPLPWDIMPNDAQDTRDYPNMPLKALDITSAATGQDAINSTVQLTQPLYAAAAGGGGPPPDPNNRVPVPTAFNVTIHVPKYQPANVNRGIKTWKLADGTSFTFGSAYTDIGGFITGGGGLGSQDILGPLAVMSGKPVNVTSGIAYPAGGYVNELIVEAVPAGGLRGAQFNPNLAFNDSTSDGGTTVPEAYRAVELGTSVPPSVTMRVVEQTIDLGKLPHGTGYSPVSGGSTFQFPFSPSGTPDWANAPWNGLSPWDNANLIGQFFRPFTLVNESNVNLYDVRVGKLMGDAPYQPNQIPSPVMLTSDQTSATIVGAPYSNKAGFSAAGIGLASSLDHISKIQQNGGGIFPEHPLWPTPNPYVFAQGISDASASGLQTNNAAGVGLLAWTPGFQPQPTVHKPRVGDTTGTIAMVPDTPYDSVAIPGFAPVPPEISLAIPLGTPAGTYSAPVFPFEDNVPLQWQEWLASSNGFGSDGSGGFIDTSHDGIINSVLNPSTGTRTPIEPYANPTFTVKATVREARLTGGATAGSLSQIDTFIQGLLSHNPIDGNGNVRPDVLTGPFGPNLLPAVMFQPTGNATFQLDLFWSTPRQPGSSPFVTSSGPRIGQPVADAPWAIGYSSLFEGISGWSFANVGTNGFGDGSWWGAGGGKPFGVFPGYDGAGQPLNIAALFPSTPNEAATLNVPYVPGTRMPRTVRYASPSAAVRTLTGPPANYPTGSQVGWLIWQAAIDKRRTDGSQITDSRTMYAPVPANSSGQPDANNIRSLLNDPALSKLSPKALLLNNGGSDILYLFWHAGNGTASQLYYNDNTSSNFPSNTWSRDTRLETPDALAWQSDPSPMYHQVWDTVNNQAMNVIDVVYTGVLKNRRTVETMLSRYQINQDGSLSITQLPDVVQEEMSRQGNTFSYAARDAAWAYGSGPQGQLLPTDKESRIKLYISRNNGPLQPLVPANKGFTSDANGDHFPIGRYDQASGLVYYDSALGGQIVIDPRSGTVSFPQVAPGRNDAIFVSYAPMVMRLNTSRDETNIVRTAGYGAFNAADPAFVPRAATVSPGSNQNPIAIMERDFNERKSLTSPQVVFPSNTGSAFPRMWVLYRKTDVSGTVKSTLYYKAMRLMARLPRPVALTNNGGQFAIKNLTVNGNFGPFEVDWARGRVYFTELDEGRTVTINYAFVGGQSGNLTYRVAWGDEISSASLPTDPSQPFIDQTTPEVVLPTDSAVNEGQVTAVQIPASLRTGPLTSNQPYQPQQGSELWVFWTSTRSGTTDLYYETIRPNFYPTAVNQH